MQRAYFWPFRLLIAAIFALAMLTIILSAINYFHDIQIRASSERFINGFEKAMKAITKDKKYGIVEEKNLLLPPGLYTAAQFAERYHMPVECIELQSVSGIIFELSEDGKRLRLNREVNTDVYYQCILENSEECEIRCYISFNQKPRVD
ncbi:MAG: hypothetical protein J7L44_00905 [Candidatus Diapherotrites archaeon]|nr:hypothetical protein [Candidatus Diapherotrites archaeon]